MSFDDPAWRSEWLRRLQMRALRRADRAGIDFDLKDPDYAVKLYDRQGGLCAVSGLEFTLERLEDALVKHPFAPSLDRKLSSGGYTEGNVRLVCVAVNFGMGQWGQEVYMQLARAAVAKEKKEQNAPDPAEDNDWFAHQREKIAATECLWKAASDDERFQLKRRIASLKRNLTLGPEGLRRAARRARNARQERAAKLSKGPIVVLKGWRKGMDKVAVTTLLRSNGVPLAEAHDATEDVLRGGSVTVQLRNGADAAVVRSELDRLGIIL